MPRTLFALWLLPALAAQAPVDFGPQQAFVQEYCVDCHGGDGVKGKLDLLAPVADPVAAAWTWQRLLTRVVAGEMPPPDAEAPSAAARAAFVAAARQELAAAVPRLPVAPGRVTVRRLSRGQWENTVRDLFGVPVSTAAFPADDLAYGFDTVGDAMTFSTLHLEKYLAAAAAVADQVFDAEDPARPTVRRLEGESMRLVDGPGVNQDGEVAGFYTRATVEGVLRLPRDGTYRVRLHAGADQAGDEPAKMLLRIDGKDFETFEVPERRLRDFVVTAPLAGGERRLQVAFINDFWDPKHADPARRDRNLRLDVVEVTGPLEPRVMPAELQWLVDAVPAKGKDAAKLRATVKAMLPRVWRRAVGDDEVARLVKLGDSALAAGEGLVGAQRQVLTAALLSPHFLFRLEPGAVDGVPGSTAPVPGPALANRLAYFVWSSGPDAALQELGRSGKLLDPAVRGRELARLLADPRADRLATDFAAQWFELRNLPERMPDPTRFPGYDTALQQAMRRETELLFLAVLREGRDVRNLLDVDFTHVDATLAAFYGLPAPAGPGFQRVPLPPSHRERGGLLGHGSFLAVTSNPTRTSPVKRGRWILDNLLGQPPPPPAPGNDSLANEQAIDSTKSFREQLAQHRARAECAVCHVRMDTLGFALERYDAIGRYRERDRGGPIDCSGELPGGKRIDGLGDLKAELLADPAFVRVFAQKLFVYALGREGRPIDRLKLDLAVDARLAAGKVTVGDLVATVVEGEAFLLRTVEAGVAK